MVTLVFCTIEGMSEIKVSSPPDASSKGRGGGLVSTRTVTVTRTVPTKTGMLSSAVCRMGLVFPAHLGLYSLRTCIDGKNGKSFHSTLPCQPSALVENSAADSPHTPIHTKVLACHWQGSNPYLQMTLLLALFFLLAAPLFCIAPPYFLSHHNSCPPQQTSNEVTDPGHTFHTGPVPVKS